MGRDGRQLLEEEPVFRRAIEACEPLVKRHAGFSLLEELAALEDRSRVQETEVAQQRCLPSMWRCQRSGHPGACDRTR